MGNAHGLSKLHLAAKCGDTEAVGRLLMSSLNVDVRDKEQNTPLHYGSLYGHYDAVNLLLSKGASVNSRNALGQTPLHLAAKSGHTCIVDILLDNHAAVDVMIQSKETPFYLAAKNGHAGVTDLLLHRGTCDFVLTEDKQTPLHVSVERGHTEVVEIILKHSSRISGKLTSNENELQENSNNITETSGIQPIKLFKFDGRRISAGLVWTETNTPLEMWRNSSDETAIDLAVLSAQPKMVQILLNTDQYRYSEQHLRKTFHNLTISISRSNATAATYSSNKKTVEVPFNHEQYLPFSGSTIKFTHVVFKLPINDEQYDMFCKRTKEIAQILVHSSKFNVNLQDIEGHSPLHKAMMSLKFVEKGKWVYVIYMMQLLLEKGADFNLKDSTGKTPLMIATEAGCSDAIQMLFDWEEKSGNKLDLDERDQNGATALIYAAEKNDVIVMRLLLSHKASVNLHDSDGFTALHAVVYESSLKSHKLHSPCGELRELKCYGANSLETSSSANITRESFDIQMLTNFLLGEENLNPRTVIDRPTLQNFLENNKATIQLREESVKVLLDNDDTDVNAIDFRGNTPLDLALKTSKRIYSATLKALRNRGAIQKSKEPEHEASLEVARVDNRGHNSLHRLFISGVSDCLLRYDITREERDENVDQFDLMVNGILLSPMNFRELANATDKKGRTPLHYAAIMSEKTAHIKVLLEIGSKVNAADIYGKTPLHYTEQNENYELLLQHGADQNAKDNCGFTPGDLKQLRALAASSEENAWKTVGKLPLSNMDLYLLTDIEQVLNTNHVTELTKRKLVKTIRINSQSPCSKESPEDEIWKIWIEGKFFRVNSHLSQLKPYIQYFVDSLADGIKDKDWRFECQTTLVGSAEEETKASISGDFDFNFRLIKFGKFCDPFPHPLGPTGYFQLRRKTNENTDNQSNKPFDTFFNSDHYLLTDEVNSRFKIILEEVLSDPTFWQNEHLFDWNMAHEYIDRYHHLGGKPMCKTIRLRMLNPIADGENGFLFVNISIDIVACIHVEDWWPEDTFPVGINPSVKKDGCVFVFHRPNLRQCIPRDTHLAFFETFARISFAPQESRIIKESSPLIKAAYMVCKMIFNSVKKDDMYQLKTCLLYCMEDFIALSGSQTKRDEEISPEQLFFWVERIVFRYVELSRLGVYSCYFMPSFRRRALRPWGVYRCLMRKELRLEDFRYSFWLGVYRYLKRKEEQLEDFHYSSLYGFYLKLCPDGCTFDIPTAGICDPILEYLDLQEVLRKLSPRNFQHKDRRSKHMDGHLSLSVSEFARSLLA